MKQAARQALSQVMVFSTFLCALVVLVPLISILTYLVSKGIGSLNLDFFTHLPKPTGEEGGGMANAIWGSFILVGLACLWALPVGILGGVYLAEFGKGKICSAIRFTADVMTGVPSIVTGIFAYGLFVVPMKGFSALSGSFALGLMLIPTTLRTTEEMVRTVPNTLREAALALGISRYRTTMSVVVKTAMTGIVTGVLLTIARVAGETAPLLFTAFGNRNWSTNLTDPISSLPLQIFIYAISPFDDWHRQAWAGALVLIGMIFALTLISRFATKSKFRKQIL